MSHQIGTQWQWHFESICDTTIHEYPDCVKCRTRDQWRTHSRNKSTAPSLFSMLLYQDNPSYPFSNNSLIGTQDDWHLLQVNILHSQLLLLHKEGHGHLLYPGQIKEGVHHKLQQALNNSTRSDRFMEEDDHILSHLLLGGEDQVPAFESFPWVAKFPNLTIVISKIFQKLFCKFFIKHNVEEEKKR